MTLRRIAWTCASFSLFLLGAPLGACGPAGDGDGDGEGSGGATSDGDGDLVLTGGSTSSGGSVSSGGASSVGGSTTGGNDPGAGGTTSGGFDEKWAEDGFSCLAEEAHVLGRFEGPFSSGATIIGAETATASGMTTLTVYNSSGDYEISVTYPESTTPGSVVSVTGVVDAELSSSRPKAERCFEGEMKAFVEIEGESIHHQIVGALGIPAVDSGCTITDGDWMAGCIDTQP